MQNKMKSYYFDMYWGGKMDDEQCDYQKYGGQEMNVLGKFWIGFLFVHILLISLMKGFSYFH